MTQRGAITKARRLSALPELLERKPRTTAELAKHFAVPRRTVQRDLETLREEGYGVESPERGLYLIPSSPPTSTQSKRSPFTPPPGSSTTTPQHATRTTAPL